MSEQTRFGTKRESYKAALESIREYLEPHPSWNTDELRRRAMSEIMRTIGASSDRMAIEYPTEVTK